MLSGRSLHVPALLALVSLAVVGCKDDDTTSSTGADASGTASGTASATAGTATTTTTSASTTATTTTTTTGTGSTTATTSTSSGTDTDPTTSTTGPIDTTTPYECRPSCPGDATRTVFAGGAARGDQGNTNQFDESACRQFDGDQSACETAYQQTSRGVASCFYDSGNCRPCGAERKYSYSCVNTCIPNYCPGDPARIIEIADDNHQCDQFDDNKMLCERAYYYDNGRDIGISCWYDNDNDECNGCGGSNLFFGVCENTCFPNGPCPGDPTRFAAGGYDAEGCQEFAGSPSACNQAYNLGEYNNTRAYACYYDPSDEDLCIACGPKHGYDGREDCVDACAPAGYERCEDPTRTELLPGSNACRVYDDDKAKCETAYHNAWYPGEYSTCWYDDDSDNCYGCGPKHEGFGHCVNTCRSGPFTGCGQFTGMGDAAKNACEAAGCAAVEEAMGTTTASSGTATATASSGG